MVYKKKILYQWTATFEGLKEKVRYKTTITRSGKSIWINRIRKKEPNLLWYSGALIEIPMNKVDKLIKILRELKKVK